MFVVLTSKHCSFKQNLDGFTPGFRQTPSAFLAAKKIRSKDSCSPDAPVGWGQRDTQVPPGAQGPLRHNNVALIKTSLNPHSFLAWMVVC